MRIKLFNRILVIEFIDLDRTVVGLDSSSFCDNGQVLLLDYDNLSLEEVREDIRRLQQKFGLPTMYIFNSSEDKYHVYCMSCFKFHEVVAITFNSRSDDHHKECLLKFKVSTLRITEKKGKPSKIKFVEMLPSKFKGEIPEAKKILEIIFNTKIRVGVPLSTYTRDYPIDKNANLFTQ